jgi:hypothetical protein
MGNFHVERNVRPKPSTENFFLVRPIGLFSVAKRTMTPNRMARSWSARDSRSRLWSITMYGGRAWAVKHSCYTRAFGGHRNLLTCCECPRAGRAVLLGGLRIEMAVFSESCDGPS